MNILKKIVEFICIKFGFVMVKNLFVEEQYIVVVVKLFDKIKDLKIVFVKFINEEKCICEFIVEKNKQVELKECEICKFFFEG